MKMVKRTVQGSFAACAMLLALAPLQAQQTTKEIIKGTAKTTTEKLNGTVQFVKGNSLVVKMSTGEIRQFTVQPSRRFIIDGKELSVDQLQPGTTLTATTTSTSTTSTQRTTTSGTGTVLWVNGNVVTLQLANNDVKTYTVPESYKFNVEGKQATAQDLRPGMKVSAEKIVEVPHVDFESNTVVTGRAPKK